MRGRGEDDFSELVELKFAITKGGEGQRLGISFEQEDDEARTKAQGGARVRALHPCALHLCASLCAVETIP